MAARQQSARKVVRASTAAPSYFDPEPITIASEKGKKAVIGTFVDGGVSPFNNPSFQAFLYVTLSDYHVQWGTGAEQLLLVSCRNWRLRSFPDAREHSRRGSRQGVAQPHGRLCSPGRDPDAVDVGEPDRSGD